MTSTAPQTSSISIIIPTRNEAPNIAATLDRARSHAVREVIVVDGDSRDGTGDIAHRHGARVISSDPGRARQMNSGAAIARGEVLLFLHGDTLLPPDFAAQIHDTLAQNGVVAGAFPLAIALPGIAARLIGAMATFRSRIWGMPYGDQGIFLPRATFEAIGNFPEEPILEDVLLMQRLKKRGRIGLTRSAVLTSGRRWQELGFVRTTLINQLIIMGHLAGVSPHRLQRWYRFGKKI